MTNLFRRAYCVTAKEQVVFVRSAMITAALLHPDVSSSAVEPFRRVASGITVQESAEISASLDAALIFGGDGTVHRNLPAL